ncbi:MAG: endonuclease III domain-containing protein [Candidatus Omnitrophica bacterium]|nr:endonuclease III domain-containing protein [Candidatus Omnitrophota bacterium]
MKQKLNLIYKKLYSCFGAQNWWPAESPFEVIIGAILTQNTSWQNVSRAIENLKKEKVLTPQGIKKISEKKLAALIRPSGYYNIKSKRLKNFLIFLFKNYNGSIERMSLGKPKDLRKALLGVNGIGPETADSILLYALGKPVFVVDAYTKRILSRHKIIEENAPYHQVQDLLMNNLHCEKKLFNEFHALLVRLAKEYCLKSKRRCNECPLKGLN